FLFAKMESVVVEERMEEKQIRFCLPVIPLELVAGVAAIDQIIETVVSGVNAGLKVVNGHFRADVGFADAAVAAAEIVSNANRLAQGTPHQERPAALRIRDFSASIA